MTLIDYIRESVEGIGCAFLYNAEGEMNDIVARCPSLQNDGVVCLCYLLKNGTAVQVGGTWRERVNVGLFFSMLSEYDFSGTENEERLECCKQYALRWLQSLVNSADLRLISVNSTERVYNNTTDLLTAYAVNVTIESIKGITPCNV